MLWQAPEWARGLSVGGVGAVVISLGRLRSQAPLLAFSKLGHERRERKLQLPEAPVPYASRMVAMV